MDNQTEQPTNPPVENPVQSPASNRSTVTPPPPKSFLSNKLILIVIILIIVLGIGGTYLALNSKPKLNQTVSKATTISIPTPIDETANWKSYTGRGFTFKYPQDYQTSEGLEFLTLKKDSETPTIGEISPNGRLISFKILINQRSLSLEQYVENEMQQRASQLYDKKLIVPDLKKTISIDNKPSQWYEGNLGAAVKHIEVYIPKDNQNILLVEVYVGERVSDNQSKNLSQILSTFKFTN